MPRRRPVSNLLALAVLTVVVQRPMHPYEMASVLRSRGKDQDMPIKWGSLYTVVRNLEKHGLLEAVESGRQVPAPSAPSTASPTRAAGRPTTGPGSCCPSRAGSRRRSRRACR